MAKSINNLPVINWLNLKNLQEHRKVILLTTPTAEKTIKNSLRNLNVHKKMYIDTSQKKEVEKIINNKTSGEIIYAIGGGRVIDVGRYLAIKWGLEIICIPTIISSDAFLVDCTGLREHGCVTYLPSKKADKIILDWSILKNIPKKYHIVGCSDVLSIFTGLEDWKYINKIGKARPDEIYSQSVAKIAKSILESLMIESDNIKNGTKKGVETIILTLAMEVALCNFYGNSRPEEGGEHFFTYCAENYVPHFLHGEMVAFGILLTAYIQGLKWKKIKEFMDYVQLNYRPKGLTKKIVVKILKNLPTYVKKHRLRYSIYNDFFYSKQKDEIEWFLNKVSI